MDFELLMFGSIDPKVQTSKVLYIELINSQLSNLESGSFKIIRLEQMNPVINPLIQMTTTPVNSIENLTKKKTPNFIIPLQQLVTKFEAVKKPKFYIFESLSFDVRVSFENTPTIDFQDEIESRLPYSIKYTLFKKT